LKSREIYLLPILTDYIKIPKLPGVGILRLDLEFAGSLQNMQMNEPVPEIEGRPGDELGRFLF